MDADMADVEVDSDDSDCMPVSNRAARNRRVVPYSSSDDEKDESQHSNALFEVASELRAQQLADPERERRKLHKTLRRIEDLKRQRAAGASLSRANEKKLAREAEVTARLQALASAAEPLEVERQSETGDLSDDAEVLVSVKLGTAAPPTQQKSRSLDWRSFQSKEDASIEERGVRSVPLAAAVPCALESMMEQ